MSTANKWPNIRNFSEVLHGADVERVFFSGSANVDGFNASTRRTEIYSTR